MDDLIRDSIMGFLRRSGLDDMFDIQVQSDGYCFGVNIIRQDEFIGGYDFVMDPSMGYDANVRDIAFIGDLVVEKCRGYADG